MEDTNLQPCSKPLIFLSMGRAVVPNGSKRAVSRRVFGDWFSGGVIASADSRITRESSNLVGSETVEPSDLLDSPLTDRSSRRGFKFHFAAFARCRDTAAACDLAARREVSEKIAVSVLMNTTELPPPSRSIGGKLRRLLSRACNRRCCRCHCLQPAGTLASWEWMGEDKELGQTNLNHSFASILFRACV
jgi:hypothetical protein